MDLAFPPVGKGKRTWICFNCDGPDPLDSTTTHGWLRGELGDKNNPKTVHVVSEANLGNQRFVVPCPLHEAR